MIEPLEGFPDNVVALACHGTVTRREYEDVLTPRIEAGLKQHDRLRLYYQVASDFTGIEPGAVWEDFKLGMEHLSRWERIALVSDIDWMRFMVQGFGFLLPGKIRCFI